MEVSSWENPLFLWVIYTMAILRSSHRETAEIRIASDFGVAKFVQLHQNAWARRG